MSQALSRHHDLVEPLGVRIAPLLPKDRRAIPHASLDGLEVTDLAPVAPDRLELQVDGVRDVQDQLRVLPLDEENISHTVRFVLGGQFRKGEMVSGKRVNAVEVATSSSAGIQRPSREIVLRQLRDV